MRKYLLLLAVCTAQVSGARLTETLVNISTSLTQAHTELADRPLVCTHGLKEELDSMYTEAIYGLGNCLNFPGILSKLGDFLQADVLLFADLVLNVGKLIQLTGECETFNPIGILECWDSNWTEIESIFAADGQDLRTVLHTFALFLQTIETSIVNCFTPRSESLQTGIAQVLAKARECSSLKT